VIRIWPEDLEATYLLIMETITFYFSEAKLLALVLSNPKTLVKSILTPPTNEVTSMREKTTVFCNAFPLLVD